jgi:hypothetical protein
MRNPVLKLPHQADAHSVGPALNVKRIEPIWRGAEGIGRSPPTWSAAARSSTSRGWPVAVHRSGPRRWPGKARRLAAGKSFPVSLHIDHRLRIDLDVHTHEVTEKTLPTGVHAEWLLQRLVDDARLFPCSVIPVVRCRSGRRLIGPALSARGTGLSSNASGF